MHHQTFGRKLNRDIKERKALFKSLVVGLINSGKIRTTLAKGKAISGLVDKLITHAKNGSNGAMNKLLSFFGSKDPVEKLLKEIIPSFTDRIAGFTRMRRIGKRIGDNTEEVMLEWTVVPKQPQKTAKKKIKPVKKENKKEKIVKEKVMENKAVKK